jgi:RNA polymerase sigma-70 factor (ECF subfamily)
VDSQDDTWRTLMRAAQAGDRLAYERLLHDITPFVRNLARRHYRQPEDLEEAVQETLLTVHRVRHTYDPGRPFSPWLAAITHRRTIDILRRRLRIAHYESVDMEAVETFATPAANPELEAVRSAEEVKELLKQLPARQREALETLKLRELSLAEASRTSGQSVGALKVNTHRALKALRALIQGRERKS